LQRCRPSGQLGIGQLTIGQLSIGLLPRLR